MPPAAPDQFDDEDDGLDPEGPDPADLDDDGDDAETVPCPYCHKPVYEQLEVCPHCGSFVSFEEAPRRRPWWIWAGAVLALAGMLWWVM